MSGFRFPLERVLSWRQTQLSLAEADLERARADLRNAETQLADLARRDCAATESMRNRQNLSGSEMAGLQMFREWANREEKTLQCRIVDCKLRVATLTDIVTEARRKARLMERLKEKRRELHDVAFNRELEQMAAESVISGWCRSH